MVKSSSKSSVNFFQTMIASPTKNKQAQIQLGKTPEHKKSAAVLSPQKITQSTRISNLEQRLKERKNRASSIKFYKPQQ